MTFEEFQKTKQEMTKAAAAKQIGMAEEEFEYSVLVLVYHQNYYIEKDKDSYNLALFRDSFTCKLNDAEGLKGLEMELYKYVRDEMGEFQTTEEKWKNKAVDSLVGKTIVQVRYMTDKEAKDFGWYHRPLIIIFSDKTFMIPQRDDEGNDGGAIYYGGNPEHSILPVM